MAEQTEGGAAARSKPRSGPRSLLCPSAPASGPGPCWAELPEAVWHKIFRRLLLGPYAWSSELDVYDAIPVSLVCRQFNALVWQAAAGATVAVHTGAHNAALLRKMPGITRLRVTLALPPVKKKRKKVALPWTPTWEADPFPGHDFNEDFEQFVNGLLGQPEAGVGRSLTCKQQDRRRSKAGSKKPPQRGNACAASSSSKQATARRKEAAAPAPAASLSLDQVLPNLKELHLSLEEEPRDPYDEIGPSFSPCPGTSLDLSILKRCPAGMQLTLHTMRCPSAFVEGLHSLTFEQTDVSDLAMMTPEQGDANAIRMSRAAEAHLDGSCFDSFAALKAAASLRVLRIKALTWMCGFAGNVTTALLQHLPPTLEALVLEEAARFTLPSPYAFPPSLKSFTLTGFPGHGGEIATRPFSAESFALRLEGLPGHGSGGSGGGGGATRPFRPGGLPPGLEALTLDFSSMAEDGADVPPATAIDVSYLPDSLSALTIRGIESPEDAPFSFLGNWPRSLSRLKIGVTKKWPKASISPTFQVPLHPQVVVEHADPDSWRWDSEDCAKYSPEP